MFKKMLSARALTVAGAVALALGAVSATQAADEQANLTVSAEVVANCSIATSPVDFGDYDPLFANATDDLEVEGTVSVTCTTGASTTVTLDQGGAPDSGSTDTTPERQMSSGANRLAYELFRDSGRTQAWGNTSGTGVAHTGTGVNADLPVYGRLPAGQSVPVGSYVDTVVATITF